MQNTVTATTSEPCPGLTVTATRVNGELLYADVAVGGYRVGRYVTDAAVDNAIVVYSEAGAVAAARDAAAMAA